MENRNENDEGIPGAKPPVALSEGTVPETGTGFAASTIADAPAHEYTEASWRQEGERRFGENPMHWRFICPVCKWVASVQEWKDAGAGEDEAAFSCIGRRVAIPTQCNYAGGGLFRLNPVRVLRDSGNITTVFDFAPDEYKQPKKLSDFRPR